MALKDYETRYKATGHRWNEWTNCEKLDHLAHRLREFLNSPVPGFDSMTIVYVHGAAKREVRRVQS